MIKNASLLNQKDHDSNVSPSISMDNVKNVSLGNFVLYCKFVLANITQGVKFSYFKNLGGNQLMLRSILAMAYSVFFRSISNIVFLRSYSKVLWIYTSWIVATVKNKFSYWNFAKDKFITKTVGKLFAKFSITITSFTSLPKPTRFRFFDFSPKPFLSSLDKRLLSTRTRTENITESSTRWGSLKRLLTEITSKDHSTTYYNLLLL